MPRTMGSTSTRRIGARSMPNCHDCGTCVDVCWSRDVEAWVCIDCREQRIKRTIEDNRTESEAETAENERMRRANRGS